MQTSDECLSQRILENLGNLKATPDLCLEEKLILSKDISTIRPIFTDLTGPNLCSVLFLIHKSNFLSSSFVYPE